MFHLWIHGMTEGWDVDTVLDMELVVRTSAIADWGQGTTITFDRTKLEAHVRSSKGEAVTLAPTRLF